MTKQNNDKNEKRIWWKKKWKNEILPDWLYSWHIARNEEKLIKKGNIKRYQRSKIIEER